LTVKFFSFLILQSPATLTASLPIALVNPLILLATSRNVFSGICSKALGVCTEQRAAQSCFSLPGLDLFTKHNPACGLGEGSTAEIKKNTEHLQLKLNKEI